MIKKRREEVKKGKWFFENKKVVSNAYEMDMIYLSNYWICSKTIANPCPWKAQGSISIDRWLWLPHGLSWLADSLMRGAIFCLLCDTLLWVTTLFWSNGEWHIMWWTVTYYGLTYFVGFSRQWIKIEENQWIFKIKVWWPSFYLNNIKYT